ncbi:MAG: hypothetical protein L0332_19795 [Chloroflexi bacterium]|nr:hypothetical protein [Chloroflexota bacterium]MCI0578642.1 hypothetical protein [Chloroflexota bacterium]MCI0647215.1 hypothetical protein [Chloroflexota bacterium]MCI0728941.1 hypothetical protein [Chloroflexota bacterium]
MSTRSKFVYLLLVLVIAFSSLATAAFAAVHVDISFEFGVLKATSLKLSGSVWQPGEAIAGDCQAGQVTPCP